MSKYIVYILLVTTTFISCTYENVAPIDTTYFGFDYYPLEVGRYVEYKVEETVYDVFGENTSQFEVKLLMADSFITGDFTNFVVNRYVRSTSDDDWRIDVVWSATIIENQLVLQKNSMKYALLNFPVGEGIFWNGNGFNTLDEDTYEMNGVNEEFSLGDTYYPITLTVVQHDNLDELVEMDYRVQVFAKDVGLIYHEVKNLIYCAEVDCFGQKKIDEGIKYKQVISTYGKE